MVTGNHEALKVASETARKAALAHLQTQTPGSPQQPPAAIAPPGDGERESQTDALIRIGKELELFHDPDSNCFAQVPAGKGQQRTTSITPRGLGSYLRHTYYRETGKGVSDGSLTTALATLSSIAEHDGGCHPVYTRLGVRDDAQTVVLDLANDESQAMVITAAGWRVTDTPPVRLWKPHGMRPLPTPQRRGKIDPLWKLLNVEEEDRILVAAWLLMALHPSGPYPGLFLHGEQGSAKSTTAGLLRELIDPNKCPLRQPPRDEDALVLAARNGLVVGLDNLSHIDQQLSDSLCRLMTGGGIGKRKLYTDADEVLLDIKRPVLVTSIPETATAGDLADRTIALHLPTIGEEQRLLDADVRKRFAELHPQLLGALLDGVSLALRDHRRCRLAGLSRMADFEVWAFAGLPALGFDPAKFLAAYRANKGDAAAAVLENSPVAAALQAFMAGKQRIDLTAAELLEQLRRHDDDHSRDRSWPKTPRGLSGILRRLAPAFRKVWGLCLTFGDRDGHERRRLISVSKSAEGSSAPSAGNGGDCQIPW